MNIILPYIQIGVAVLLMLTILLQRRGEGGLGAAFGQGEGGSYATKRGFQKRLFQATIVLGILFITLAILNLVLTS